MEADRHPSAMVTIAALAFLAGAGLVAWLGILLLDGPQLAFGAVPFVAKVQQWAVLTTWFAGCVAGFAFCWRLRHWAGAPFVRQRTPDPLPAPTAPVPPTDDAR